MAWLVPRSERSKQETRTHTHIHSLMNWDKAVQPAAPRLEKRRGAENLRSVSQPLRVARAEPLFGGRLSIFASGSIKYNGIDRLSE